MVVDNWPKSQGTVDNPETLSQRPSEAFAALGGRKGGVPGSPSVALPDFWLAQETSAALRIFKSAALLGCCGSLNDVRAFDLLAVYLQRHTS